ncbi:histidinol-phosphate transaminase [Alloscardovia macacae]|uniref:Histidinol-phosphate aminotransferase n=1 Tax=Alloscardovia macacae TaxID=1160091 RepID=A0A261F232_9BIFI|nr:histidinol-phosphate transaminase [Alloscardovia macacae]OZG53174.1 histidinol-phosphate aminotransferase [Alloscardovia macacae]
MTDMTGIPLRSDLLGEEPYGAPQLDVPVCLNVNENPYAPSPEVVETITARIAEIAPTLNRYPDREHTALREALATYLKRETGVQLAVENLWAANGSNEIMLQIFQAFGGPGRTALSFAPTYSMYPEYARDTFTAWQTVPRRSDFTVDVQAGIDAIARVKPSIVLLTSPNNPTGTPISVQDIERIAAACAELPVEGAPGAHPVLVVDEAYAEFRAEGTPSAHTLIARYPLVAVSRTLSKAFAFAGARVGYVASSRAVIDALRIVRMPYHLSALTQAAALAALEHTEGQLSQVAHLRATREETASWLRSQGLEVAASDSNFLLFGRFADCHAVFEGMLARGVLIREVGPEGYLRVCMGTDEEMTVFRNALSAVVEELE